MNNIYDNYKKETYDFYLMNNIPKEFKVKQKEQKNIYKSYKFSQSGKLRAQKQEYNQYSLGITNQQNLLNDKYRNYKSSIEQEQSALEDKYDEYTSRVNLEKFIITSSTLNFINRDGLGPMSCCRFLNHLKCFFIREKY